MIICHSRRFIYFSNPKTGSESFRALLSPWAEEEVVPYRQTSAARPFYPHMPPAEAAMAFARRGWRFGDYFRVTNVRDPFTRLVSLYRMIAEVDGLWRLRRRIGIGNPDFGTWLRGTGPSGRGGGRLHQKWRRHGTWSAREWCGSHVDAVIRIEFAQVDFDGVAKRLGLPVGPLPRVNVRGSTALADWYDEELIALVCRRYAWDLDRFGYAVPDLRAHA